MILKGRSAAEIIDVVRGMQEIGLGQGTDFSFKFFPTEYDPVSGHMVTDKHAVFTFYDDKWATLFALKWYESN
jgi:hypothetical protein